MGVPERGIVSESGFCETCAELGEASATQLDAMRAAERTLRVSHGPWTPEAHARLVEIALFGDSDSSNSNVNHAWRTRLRELVSQAIERTAQDGFEEALDAVRAWAPFVDGSTILAMLEKRAAIRARGTAA